MCTHEGIGFVEFDEVGGGEVGDVVGMKGGGVGAESTADYLFHLAGVKVDAWAEARHFKGVGGIREILKSVVVVTEKGCDNVQLGLELGL